MIRFIVCFIHLFLIRSEIEMENFLSEKCFDKTFAVVGILKGLIFQ